MKNVFPVVTLCGSTKFKDEFLQVQKQLTLRGIIVISVGAFGHQPEDSDVFAKPETKSMLDKMHEAKIDMADAIVVIDVNNYIGESTLREIGYAKSQDKDIYFLSDFNDYDKGFDNLAVLIHVI
jgi:nucleoside 2-deoxyribosyltransferase